MLFKTVKDQVHSIIKSSTQEYRDQVLDKNVHVMELSFNALKYSAPSMTEEDYIKFIQVLKNEYPVESSLKVAVRSVQESRGMYAVLVIDKKYGTYLIGTQYKNLQGRLANILKISDGLSEFTSTNTFTRSTGNKVTQLRANVGHIASDFIQGTKTPTETKLLDLAYTLDTGYGRNLVLGIVGELHKAHDVYKVGYNFTRDDFDTAGFNKILGTFSVLVTLQSFEVNNKLSTEIEGRISKRLTDLLKDPKFQQELANTKGSNSINEDIDLAIVSALKGQKVLSKHTTHKDSAKVNLPKSKGTGIKDIFPKISALSKPKTESYSLASLESLIRRHLQNVVAANMGDGSSKNTLNYRTGRLAASARLERLTQSKEGMITAFYTYMRNPYGTFSEGGIQQYPRTRDPKLLIGGSIKEIMSQRVSNRMRAVLV